MTMIITFSIIADSHQEFSGKIDLARPANAGWVSRCDPQDWWETASYKNNMYYIFILVSDLILSYLILSYPVLSYFVLSLNSTFPCCRSVCHYFASARTRRRTEHAADHADGHSDDQCDFLAKPCSVYASKLLESRGFSRWFRGRWSLEMRPEGVFPDQAVGCQTKILFAFPRLGNCAG